MAQLAEQLICNQQVIGSSPIIGLVIIKYGGIPEWPKGADCKSVSCAFGGSNPPSPTHNKSIKSIVVSYNLIIVAGWSSLEARRAHNPKVAGSNPAPAILCKVCRTSTDVPW